MTHLPMGYRVNTYFGGQTSRLMRFQPGTSEWLPAKAEDSSTLEILFQPDFLAFPVESGLIDAKDLSGLTQV